jgi:hypothetical protein
MGDRKGPSMKAILITTAAFFASQVFGSEPLEVVGCVTSANSSLFVLYDVEAKQNSHWVALGQDWRGYTLKSFEPRTEKLTVSKDTKEYVLSFRISKAGQTTSVATLTKGTYKLVDGTVVYSPEAQMKIGGKLIFSPTGVMVSDESQKIFSGDLAIETARGTVQFSDAVLTLDDAGIKLTAKSAHLAVKPSVLNQSPDPTPKSAMSSAGQPARQP